MNAASQFDVLKFRQGDKQAFKLVYDCLFKNICLFVYKYVHNQEVAEDIAQETFVTLWGHKLEMDSWVHIKSFLYLISRNASLDYLKHEKIKGQYCDFVLANYEDSETFMNFVIEEEVERILLQTEADLSPRCKEIFILSMQEKSNEEIAMQLKISVNTVKTQKKIAYKILKHHISELSVLIVWLSENI